MSFLPYLLDLAPINPLEMLWYQYGTVIIIAAVLLAIIAGIAIIMLSEKTKNKEKPKK